MASKSKPSISRLITVRRFVADPPVSTLIGAIILGIAWTLLTRLPQGAAQPAAAPPSPRAGFAAPDFTLPTLAGDEITLSELRGQPVLLNIWASWCLPCRAEMPAIERVWRRSGADGLIVIGLNATSQDSEAAARLFAEELGLTFPILLDRDGSAVADYELMGLPSTYFIGSDGIIREVIIGGPMSEALMLSKVDDLLQEP